MRPSSALLLAAAVLTLASTAVAADAPTAQTVPKPKKALLILTPEEVEPSRLLPPPAKDGTDLQKADLAEVERVYKDRSAERRAKAEWDDKHESAELFAATLGPRFDLAKLPATAALLKAVDNEQSVVANMAKRYFLRNRPWAIDPKLVACDYKPNAAPFTSYPSGHATLSYSMGFVLAKLMPDKAQPILDRAQEYAYSRVVCGAHYPSDIEASHVLGTELAMLMLESPRFQAQFKVSRAELQAAGLTR